MGYLFCDDLIVPIEEALSKEKIGQVMKDMDFGSKSKVVTWGFTVNIKDCQLF